MTRNARGRERRVSPVRLRRGMAAVMVSGVLMLGATIWLLFALPEGATVTGQRHKTFSTFAAHPTLMLLYAGLVALIGGTGLAVREAFAERRLAAWFVFIAVTAAIVWLIQFFEALGQL